MNIDYFKNIRILDGGMGQELLRRGLKPKGTLWSANALINENYHNLVILIYYLMELVEAPAPAHARATPRGKEEAAGRPGGACGGSADGAPLGRCRKR